MRTVVLPETGTFTAWRDEARALLGAGVPPEDVLWQRGTAEADLFAEALPLVSGGEVRGPYGYFYRLDESIECTARGDLQRVCWVDRREIMQQGNSFAAPHIAGIAALMREAQPDAPPAVVRSVLRAYTKIP